MKMQRLLKYKQQQQQQQQQQTHWKWKRGSAIQLETKRVGTNLFSVPPYLNHVHGGITDSFSYLIS